MGKVKKAENWVFLEINERRFEVACRLVTI